VRIDATFVLARDRAMTMPRRASILRGRHGRGNLAGPLPGARLDQVVAYDFELPGSFEPWPGRTRRERTYVMLEFGVSFANPSWVRHTREDGLIVDRTLEGPGTWYVDLVSVAVEGDVYTFRDLYVDVMVPVDGRHYRMLDLDEFADALQDGVLGVDEAVDALRRWQRFLDRHLHAPREPIGTWTDFPPAAIAPLVDLPPFVSSLAAQRIQPGPDAL
jgi:Protein of unknown function (DUF402)